MRLYTNPLYNSKTLISNASSSLFEKMTWVWGRDCLTRRRQVSEISTSLSSINSDQEDYKNPLDGNKQRIWPAKASTPAFVGLPPTPDNANTDVAQFTQKNLDQINQVYLLTQVSK